MQLKYIKRLALFETLREGLNRFLKETIEVEILPEYLEAPPPKNNLGYAPGEENIECLALAMKRVPRKTLSDKLFVIAHYAAIIKQFLDEGEFWNWCKENQDRIIVCEWPQLRKELALIEHLLTRQEALSSATRGK